MRKDNLGYLCYTFVVMVFESDFEGFFDQWILLSWSSFSAMWMGERVSMGIKVQWPWEKGER